MKETIFKVTALDSRAQVAYQVFVNAAQLPQEVIDVNNDGYTAIVDVTSKTDEQ